MRVSHIRGYVAGKRFGGWRYHGKMVKALTNRMWPNTTQHIGAITPGYYWFRHNRDGNTFIALYAEDENDWFMPGLGPAITNVMQHATLLGAVPRTVLGGGSIDQ